jgi:hypothetical protein
VTATYAGPRKPREEVALIYGGYGTKIVHIDGRSCNRDGREQKYEILPGIHSVSLVTFVVDHYVVASHTVWARPTTVCLEARAGHQYTFDRQEALQGFKIIDVTTNTQVAGLDCVAEYDETDPKEWDRRPW